MRAETFFEQQSSFPDIDGVWNFDDLNQTEITIRDRLPPFTEKTWTAPQIELLTQLARVQSLQGKLLEAAGFLALVKELNTRISDGSRRLEIRYLLEQGRVYTLAKTPIQAQECFRQAWVLASEKGETFFAIDAALMLALCQARKLQKEWLFQALKLAQDSTTDDKCKLWLGYLFLLVGWDYFDMRKYSEAYSEFNKAFEIKKSHDVQWALGRTLRAMNKFDEALTVQTTLLGEFSALGKVNGYVYLEVAECYQLLKKFDDAKRYFDLAYKSLLDNKWFADNKGHELSRIQHLSK